MHLSSAGTTAALSAVQIFPILSGGTVGDFLGSLDMSEEHPDNEVARRRDAALLRALSTPHKKQAEMKIGRPSGGRRPAVGGQQSPSAIASSRSGGKRGQLRVGDSVAHLQNPEAPRMLYRVGIWRSRTQQSDTICLSQPSS